MMVRQSHPAQGTGSAQLRLTRAVLGGAAGRPVSGGGEGGEATSAQRVSGWSPEPGRRSGRWARRREEPDLWARPLGPLDVEEAEATELAGCALGVARPLPPFCPQDGTPPLPPFLGDGPALSPALLSEFLARGPCPLFGEVACLPAPVSSPGRKPASPLQGRRKGRWPCARLIWARKCGGGRPPSRPCSAQRDKQI